MLKTIIRIAREKGNLNVVNDQFGSPTYAADLAKVILDILAQKPEISRTEIYLYSNEGETTWYEFAKAIVELKNISCSINPVGTKDYPVLARRPANSRFSKEKNRKEIFNRYNPSGRTA